MKRLSYFSLLLSLLMLCAACTSAPAAQDGAAAPPASAQLYSEKGVLLGENSDSALIEEIFAVLENSASAASAEFTPGPSLRLTDAQGQETVVTLDRETLAFRLNETLYTDAAGQLRALLLKGFSLEDTLSLQVAYAQARLVAEGREIPLPAELAAQALTAAQNSENPVDISAAQQGDAPFYATGVQVILTPASEELPYEIYTNDRGEKLLLSADTDLSASGITAPLCTHVCDALLALIQA